MSDRARQFMPFDALKGFREEICKANKIVVDKIELSEDKIVEINFKMQQIKKNMIITIIYFKDNEYISLCGIVSNIDIVEKTITIVKTKINFDDIYDIQGDELISY